MHYYLLGSQVQNAILCVECFFSQFITAESGLFSRFVLADFCGAFVHHLLTATNATTFSSQLPGNREVQI